MVTFEWLCMLLLAFIVGVFTGYFTLHSIKDLIDLNREWKATKKNGTKNTCKGETTSRYIKVEDRLKEAEQRIADLEDNLRTGIISDPERFKIYNYNLKDLILFADMCKRNNVRDADLKQAAWNLELAVRAVMNERQEIAKNMLDEITMRFTPNFEEAYKEMMENCILPYVKGEKNEN